ncbi:hypothetical protein ABIF69_003267 [Bradyrhizobium japonicum]
MAALTWKAGPPPASFAIDPRSRRRAARPLTTRGARKGGERQRPLRVSTSAAGSEREGGRGEQLIPGESRAAFLFLEVRSR